MNKWTLPWLSLPIALAAGCADQAPTTVGTTAPTSTVASTRDFSKILPAYELPSEKRVPGKADKYDDIRKANPQYYAITAPPAGKAYRAMTEWEPMQMMLTTYADGIKNDAKVRQTIVDIVYHTVTDAETKTGVIVNTQAMADDFSKHLLAKGLAQDAIDSMVEYIIMPNDSIWHIDYGPLPIVEDGTNNVAFADFRYYHQRALDDGIPSRLGQDKFGISTYRMPFDIEGGTFQGDGLGTCYTGERALQYTGATAAELGAVWGEYLNCTQLVVMKDITDDGTGHIDMFFKLTAPDVAIMGEYKDVYVQDATNKKRMDDNAAQLAALTLPGGNPMTVYRLPFPSKAQDGTDFVPRTFLNSTIVNGVNLWPVYSDGKDAEAEALAVWQEAMPDHKHVGILCDQIAFYSGTVHCVTRTIPEGNLEKWVDDGACGDGQCTSTDGYDGACFGEAKDECWGPDWLCDCNMCNEDGTCQELVSSCEGLCDSPNGAPSGCFCDSLCVEYNDCCDDYVELCDGGSPGGCGDVTFEGCCDGTVLRYCDNGQLTTGDCAQNSQGCGWDAEGSYYNCGFEGEDPSGSNPIECGEVPTPTGCDGVTFEGCCGDNGATLRYCENDKLTELSCGDQGCGWLETEGFYDCGQEGEDPSGANPRVCSGGCEPDCSGKACGSDGCGGSCGTCGTGEKCNEGTCEPLPCKPACGDKACGSDGCGGSCGACGEAQSCKAGACSDEACTGSCEGLTCGDDGCGGDCGTCGNGETCNAGACEVYCEADCEGRVCGDDGCGGSCGDCGATETCTAAGQCKGEEPRGNSCVGQCGDQAADGCFCDVECQGRGDCCPDVCDACPAMCEEPGEDTGPEPDAGSAEDTGTGPGDTGNGGEDTGTPIQADATGSADSTGSGDSAANTDTGTGGTAGGTGGGDDGGCSTTAGTGAPAWAALLGLALFGVTVTRRRRAR